MTLTKIQNKFVAATSYAEKDVPKAAGFRWDGINKCWWTDDVKKAARLAEFAAEDIKAELTAIAENRTEALAASRAADATDLNIPVPLGIDYLPYQKAGITYASSRRSTLIADDMGLGKTAQAIGASYLSGCKNIIVVCPASLKLNWKNEVKKWLPGSGSIVLSGMPSSHFIDGFLGNRFFNHQVRFNGDKKVEYVDFAAEGGFKTDLSKFVNVFGALSLPAMHRAAPEFGENINNSLMGVGDPNGPSSSCLAVADVSLSVKETGHVCNGADVVRHFDGAGSFVSGDRVSGSSQEVLMKGCGVDSDLSSKGRHRLPVVDSSDCVVDDFGRGFGPVVSGGTISKSNHSLPESCSGDSDFLGSVVEENFPVLDSFSDGDDVRLADLCSRSGASKFPEQLLVNGTGGRVQFGGNLRNALTVVDFVSDSCGIHVDSPVFWIVNYDILPKWMPLLKHFVHSSIVFDELHYCKNKKTGRAKTCIDLVSSINPVRVLGLTGTPVCNKPSELVSQLLVLDVLKDVFGSEWKFLQRYCAGYKGRFGWDFTGASHLDELQDKLRESIMVRRLKSQVLVDLPAKRRQVIEIPASGAMAVAIDVERRAWLLHEDALDELRAKVEISKASSNPEDYATAVRNLREAAKVAFEEISKVRHDTAVAKIPAVVEHLTEMFDSVEKVVLFAHHHDVVAGLLAAFPGAAVLTGETKMADRQAAVERFQSDPSCRLFIGSIGAAGVGHTLTAASTVLFAELDWVPGNVSQCEDRCHRIGQTGSVLVQHLVLEGSLDARMAEILVSKQSVIDSALDRVHGDKVSAAVAHAAKLAADTPAVPGAAATTGSVSREQVEREALVLTAAQVVAIHSGLQILAGMCDGASSHDGMGFSKVDAYIGRQFALQSSLSARQAVVGGRLCNKYRRQLPSSLISIINGAERIDND